MTETPRYDLEERTAKFGERVIALSKRLPRDPVVAPLISQLVRSATSVGANYMEAHEVSSKKDFRNKIRISGKESRESKHWLRMITAACPGTETECLILKQEAHELTLIFAKITRSVDNGS